MRILASVTALLLATGTAHAAEKRLPTEFWGKWCAESPVTGGGGPGFWDYSRNECDNPARDYRDQDLTIGPNTIGSCKFIRITRDRYKVHHVTFHCKNGNGKFDIWLNHEDELETLGFRDVENPPYQAHPYEKK